MAEKQFVGHVKAVETQYGPIYKLGMRAEHIDTIKANLDERGWVNVAITQSKGGKWYACIDDYKPQQHPEAQPQAQEPTHRYTTQDLPQAQPTPPPPMEMPPPEDRNDDAEEEIPF